MGEKIVSSFEWSIEWPSGMLPLKPKEFLYSPIFYGDDSRTTKFRLIMKRGGNVSNNLNSVKRLFLYRWDRDGPNIVKIDYKFYMQDTDPKNRNNELTQYFIKSQSDDLPISNAQHTSVIERGISMNKWTVVCSILSHDVVQPLSSEYGDKDDLEALSHDFAKLLDNSLFSDDVIRCPNKVFKIHKAIIEARCPALLEKEQVSNLVASYSQTAITNILRYLYSGKFPSEDIPDELYNFLKSDGLHLRRLNTSFTTRTYAETNFLGKSFSFMWEIDNFLKRSKNNECVYTITEDICSWVKFRFLYEVKEGKDVLEFVVERLCGELNVFVRCLMTVHGVSENVLNSCHYFHDKDPWKISMAPLLRLIRNRQNTREKKVANVSSDLHLEETISLDVLFQICDGKRTSLVRRSNIQSSNNSQYFKYAALRGLGQDIKQLFDNPLHSDFSIKVKEKVFRVHKAILSARSEVFRNMFQKRALEKEQHDVKTLEEKVVSSMISYIYSAQISDLDVDHAIELYKAACAYKMLQLKKACVKYLSLSLNATNIIKIDSFADEEYDMDLKKSVRNFKRNAKLKKK